MLVVGTGALACLFAARLQRFGRARVTMTGNWAEGRDAIARDGIQVEDDSGRWSAAPEVVPRQGPQPPADLVLVLVKGYQTTDIAPLVARALLPTSHALTLQNGLGHREVLEAAAGTGRVSAGVVTLGATLLAPGKVRATPGEVLLGPPAPSAPGGPRFLELLEASGFAARLAPDLDTVVWRKLAVNCALNPLSALLGCPNGGLLQAPEPRATVVLAAREVAAVAGARDLDLGDAAALALAVAEGTAANRSSMLQDVERGGPTEIDCLNAAVVAEARRLGVPVPVNEQLVRRVREATQRATA